uniref:MHC class I-like antigen recognition-like domain-containing protein n=1 Tax=Otolemur garnettii TaxID=30611 RepID=H0Y1D0_OTOGA
HSLWYTFTITPKSRHQPQWCKVQAQVDKMTFLHYDCGNKATEPFGTLGQAVRGTNAWHEQIETVHYMAEELTKELLANLPEDFATSDPLILQVKMSCQHKANGHTTGSWDFGSTEKTFLTFDAENRTWKVHYAGAKQMKEKWEHDPHVTRFFYFTSMGDCKSWLTNFLMHWEKMPQFRGHPAFFPSHPLTLSHCTYFWSIHGGFLNLETLGILVFPALWPKGEWLVWSPLLPS